MMMMRHGANYHGRNNRVHGRTLTPGWRFRWPPPRQTVAKGQFDLFVLTVPSTANTLQW